ncbi:PepSY domain-containing protein [Edaphobacter sp. HDX4]|uniref:PepSY domain-containing protein n=1 Tax=Edaphobacter sp. HDX4 TaxID=2794064 RepID=UPI002FE522EA
MSRSSAHAFLRTCRLLHLYLGIFTTPALIFFSFTGALQTFSLHETTRGSSYKPPAWAVTLGQIHKKQTPVVPLRRRPPAEAKDRQDLPGSPGADQARTSSNDNRQGGRRGEVLSGQASNPVQPPALSEKRHHPLPMKIFFLIVAISLFLSTLTGLYMSYKYMRNRRTVTILLVLGTVIPVALVFV